MSKNNNNKQEDRDYSDNFEKFKNKKNNKWAQKKKFKNKKQYVEDQEERKWN